jgi:hypothetical protein
MATVPVEITWVTGQVVTAAQLNSNLRDAVNFLIARPMFVGRQTVAQSIAATTWTAALWDTEDKNNDGMHSTSTNPSRATAQTAGWYTDHSNMDWAASATGQRLIAWTINGAGRAGKVHLNAAGTFDTAENTSGMVFLNVGDYFEVTIWQNSGGALNTSSTDGNPRVQILWESN